MTAVVDFREVAEKRFWLNDFRTTEITSNARPFSHEPNALLTLCGYLSAKSFGFPGSSSPSQGRPIPWQPIPDQHPPAVNLSSLSLGKFARAC
jgi:hypothetical protein